MKRVQKFNIGSVQIESERFLIDKTSVSFEWFQIVQRQDLGNEQEQNQNFGDRFCNIFNHYKKDTSMKLS